MNQQPIRKKAANTQARPQKAASLFDRMKNRSTVSQVMDFLYLPLSFLIMEILAKLHIFGKLIDENFGFLFPLTLAMGCLASGTAFLFNGKGRRIFHIVVLAAAAILFSFHMSYQNNFHSYFSWHTLGQAKDVTEFWKEASVAAFGVWYLILAFFLPLIGVCVFGKKLTRDAQKRSLFCAAVCLVFGAGCYTGTLWHLKEYGIEDTASPYYGYVYMQKDLEQAYRNYGILNTTRLDIKQLIFGAPIEKVDFFLGLDDGGRGCVRAEKLCECDRKTDVCE